MCDSLQFLYITSTTAVPSYLSPPGADWSVQMFLVPHAPNVSMQRALYHTAKFDDSMHIDSHIPWDHLYRSQHLSRYVLHCSHMTSACEWVCVTLEFVAAFSLNYPRLDTSLKKRRISDFIRKIAVPRRRALNSKSWYIYLSHYNQMSTLHLRILLECLVTPSHHNSSGI